MDSLDKDSVLYKQQNMHLVCQVYSTRVGNHYSRTFIYKCSNCNFFKEKCLRTNELIAWPTVSICPHWEKDSNETVY